MHTFLLFVAAFLASAVEMVEALTIVLAVGVTRGWRSAGWGVAAALAGLAVIVVAPRARAGQPPDRLAAARGGHRAAGVRVAVVAQGDSAGERPQGAARRGRDLRGRGRAPPRGAASGPAHDWYAFTVAFKGVFLEGLEVAFIVVTFGGTQRNVGVAAIGALAAFVVVLIAGVIAHAPLTRVPENTLKFGVGVMLTRSGSSGVPKAPASRGPAPTRRCSG